MSKYIIWGKTDYKTKKHVLLGLALFAGFFFKDYYITETLLIASTSALLNTFVVACIWEYGQYSFNKSKMDVKDVFATCAAGIITTLILILIN